ncbi:MAG: metal ABC transporter ATP-binding protein [Myxococcota bacterium]
MSDVVIRLQEVSIGYGRPLLRPLSFTIQRGEFWGIVGPNGAGKTTLAKTILGLTPPVAGVVELGRNDLRFGYVPQRHRLNPNYPLTVADVVMLGRTGHIPMGRRPTDVDRRRVADELERLGIGSIGTQSFRSLSGGEQQRALIARALAADPDVLVLDEPSESMDLLGGTDVLLFLKRLKLEQSITVVMISHHLGDVVGAVDHLGFVNQHRNEFQAGATHDLVSDASLTRLYGRPMTVQRVNGRWLVDVQGEQE